MITLTRVNDDLDEAFTPETLHRYCQMVQELRHSMLFDIEDDGCGPLAEQHYIAALAHLELAQTALRLAEIHQMQEMKRL